MQYRLIPVTHYQQNCSLVWCEKTKSAALIDPGGDLDLIFEVIEEKGVTLEKIFLTHGHLDHVGATAELVAKTGIPVIGPHKDDQFWIDALPDQAQMMGFPPVKSFTPDQWLEEGDRVQVGQVELEVAHCPGHTPGHVVFFHRPSQVAFVGDVIFQGSIGRTDFPKGNYDQLVDSIRTKLWPMGDYVKFVPGHGAMSTFGVERKTNPFVADSRFG